MTAEAGHNYRFGPPATGWPEFKDGKIVKDEPTPQERSEAHTAECGACQAQLRPVPKPNDYGDDDFGGPA